MTETIALQWATTGILASKKKHLQISEPYAIRALCGVAAIPAGEIRPRQATWCGKCVREARKLGVDPANVGIVDPDISDVRGDED